MSKEKSKENILDKVRKNQFKPDHSSFRKVTKTKVSVESRSNSEKNTVDELVTEKQKEIDVAKEGTKGKLVNSPSTAKAKAQPKAQQKMKPEDLKKVIGLVTEGHDRISGGEDEAILLLGKTGSGKSTLAHNLAGYKLQGIVDDETGDLVLDAMQPLETIKISHKSISETKIPNKCSAAMNGADLIVWDCPGFNDTYVVQEIANGFYVQKLFKEHKKLKFVLVASEASMTADRGSSFIDVIKQFCATFTDIDKVIDSVSLVVTGSLKTKTPEHIKNKLKRIIEQHEDLSPQVKKMLSKLSDDAAKHIHIFYKPEKEGAYESQNLLSELYKNSGFTETKEEPGKISITEEAKENCVDLLGFSIDNLKKIFAMLVDATESPSKALPDAVTNFFEYNFATIKDWLPVTQAEIGLHKPPFHAETENFIYLQQLKALSKKLNQNLTGKSFDFYIDIAKGLFSTFEEYIVGKDATKFRDVIHKYAYALKQQASFCEMFRSLSSELIKEEKLLPDSVNEALMNKIKECQSHIKAAFKKAIIDLKLDANMTNEQYYLDAIEYLKIYKDEPKCIVNLALACKKIGDIHADTAPEKAVQYYFASLGYVKENPDTYKVVGVLLQKLGKHTDAIEFYKVARDTVHIKECFKELIKNWPDKYEIREARGDVHFKLGNLHKAIQYYNEAIGLHGNGARKLELAKKLFIAQDPKSHAEELKHLQSVLQTKELFDYNSIDLSGFQHLAGESDG